MSGRKVGTGAGVQKPTVFKAAVADTCACIGLRRGAEGAAWRGTQGEDAGWHQQAAAFTSTGRLLAGTWTALVIPVLLGAHV